MTQEERLLVCGKCLHRTLDYEKGYLCNLTGKVGVFENNCSDYTRDGTVTEDLILRVRKREKRPLFENEPVQESTGNTEDPSGHRKLSKEARGKLRKYQSLLYALTGGLLATAAITIGWSAVSDLIAFPEIYLSLGVGMLVGTAIRFFGAGTWKLFGILGGLFTLLACLFGSYLIHVEIVNKIANAGLKEALALLRPELVVHTFMDSYAPLDLLFYGLAVALGYLLSIRRIRAWKLRKLNSGEYSGAPVLNWLRLPLIIAGILVPVFFGYTQMNGTLGWTEQYYDSGQKMAEGGMKLNRESGQWTYWYENGNVKCRGFYQNGTHDSLWEWYDEGGRPTMTGTYNLGLEQGTWMHYHDNGTVSDSGGYVDGYREGKWKYWHENGTLYMEGEMNQGERSGRWKVYYHSGHVAENVVYRDSETILVQDVWDPEGNLMMSGGNGYYKRFSDQGDLIESGEIRDGLRTGIWTRNFKNGSPCEEGIYVDNRYLVLNSWSPEGVQGVVEGTGTYNGYFEGTRQVSESGEIRNGSREGTWKSYSRNSGNLRTEAEYVSGEQTGLKKYFYESGAIMASGSMVDGVREGEWSWYKEDGEVSITITFKDGVNLEKNLTSFFLDLF